jgi:hypothetical protein
MSCYLVVLRKQRERKAMLPLNILSTPLGRTPSSLMAISPGLTNLSIINLKERNKERKKEKRKIDRKKDRLFSQHSIYKNSYFFRSAGPLITDG